MKAKQSTIKRSGFKMKRKGAAVITVLVLLFLLVFTGCETGETGFDPEATAEFVNVKVPADIAKGFDSRFIVLKQDPDLDTSKKFQLDVQRDLKSVNGFVAKLTPEQLMALLEEDNVRWVAPDRQVKAFGKFKSDPGLLHETTGASQLERPKNKSGKFSGITGKHVGVAVLDSGIDSKHKDLKDNVEDRIVFTDDGEEGLDSFGHGTHIAGLIAGTGKESLKGEYDKYLAGMATRADLFDLKVLDSEGVGYISDVIEAVDWVIANKDAKNIRVINMSLGVPVMSSHLNDPLAVACKNAVENGLVVVAAAGNYGDYEGQTLFGGITSPANSPYVITVGAADSQGTAIRSDDQVAAFSSRGPTLYDGLPKPDMLAPGDGLKSAMSEDSSISEQYPQVMVDPCEEGAKKCDRKDPRYMALSGTSMSSAVVSGTVAMMLEANPSLTPNAVKAILMTTAQTLPDQPYIAQGAGLLNAEGAVRSASQIVDLDTINPGDMWLTEADSLEPVSIIAGEEIVWSQGLGWTGFILNGFDLLTTFQDNYTSDVAWGLGLGWTGIIIIGINPVYNTPIFSMWSEALVNPMSLPSAGVDFLVSQQVGYSGPVEFIDESNPAFPTED